MLPLWFADTAVIEQAFAALADAIREQPRTFMHREEGANAMTGAVTRKLLSTAADPHFDSLQFLDSAGAWNPNGREFVLGAVRDRDAVLTVIDIQGGGGREIVVPGVDQLYRPTWSPDGRQIAFSAMRGGVTDLFLMDLATGSVRAITTDAFSDLQPSFSPDGLSLVFATDRFTSTLDSLAFGSYRLGLVDLASGAMISRRVRSGRSRHTRTPRTSIRIGPRTAAASCSCLTPTVARTSIAARSTPERSRG